MGIPLTNSNDAETKLILETAPQGAVFLCIILKPNCYLITLSNA
ncbi:hypothetical protein SAMN06265377_2361 [Flagellimonas pacifica]|uniref:Uncharacterized protein n=1 Tax=Flagellimonas pacifica TaxID=1247520 RepID=A0A285MVH3_9FLAO|nr:hypothetical protein SAMN06265377_2361 [Allomuricauda parva]